MNKKLFFLAMAAFVLASCSNDDVVESYATSDSNAITFRPLVSGITRATSLVTNDLNSEGFYVTATYTTDGGNAYFTDKQYKYNDAVGHVRWEPWSGSAFYTIYWPNTTADVLDFHAYARAAAKASQLSVSNTNVATENGCPSYTVTPSTTAADEIDFVYATLINQDYENNSMALVFNHEESQVSIQLKNDDSGLKFTVSEVALCNIPASGIFMNRDATDVATNTDMKWGDYGSLITYSQTIDNPYFVKDGITSATQYQTSWILIPHTLKAPTAVKKYVSSDNDALYDGAYIRVKMRVQSTANEDTYYAGSSSTWVDAIWPISGAWNPRYHYTYTIDLAGGGYYEKNQVTPSGDDLDRVLNLNPITFASVTVSEWTPSGSTVGM